MLQRTSRRNFLKNTAATAAAGIVLPQFFASSLRAQPASGAKKKVLFFTKSAGFQHSVITRSPSDPQKLSYAEQILTDLGAKNDFEVVCSKDGTVFAPGSIEQFDLFAFYTTGDLTKDSDKYAMIKGPNGKQVEDKDKLLWHEPGMPPGAKEAFLKAIEDGKGFIGFHCAADTFHSPGHVKGKIDLLRDVNEKGEDEFDPYIKMIGGEFIIHGKQQDATLKVIDPTFPGAKALDDARFTEEWYSLKNFSPDLHVILAQDCSGMTGDMYQREPYPETWARMHGKGRVFYTSLGHREDVWLKQEFLGLVVGAMLWATKQGDVDLTPNLKKATPGAEPKAEPAATK
jgi:uncharacterized protein